MIIAFVIFTCFFMHIGNDVLSVGTGSPPNKEGTFKFAAKRGFKRGWLRLVLQR